MMRQMANTPPSSSEMAAKMKSLSTTGTLSGSPLPSPIPIKPPVPIANSDLATWYPSFWIVPHGSCQAYTRVLTWANRRYAAAGEARPQIGDVHRGDVKHHDIGNKINERRSQILFHHEDDDMDRRRARNEHNIFELRTFCQQRRNKKYEKDFHEFGWLDGDPREADPVAGTVLFHADDKNEGTNRQTTIAAAAKMI